MKKILFLMIALFGVAACSTTIGNPELQAGKDRLEQKADSLKTKKEVRAALGTPDLIFDKDGLEYYEYRAVKAHGRYHFAIPVIGWMASLFQDRFAWRQTNVFFGFDKSGKVKTRQVIQTTGTIN